jgi:hypothetical protein
MQAHKKSIHKQRVVNYDFLSHIRCNIVCIEGGGGELLERRCQLFCEIIHLKLVCFKFIIENSYGNSIFYIFLH